MHTAKMEQFTQAVHSEALQILDCRAWEDFCNAFVSGSLFGAVTSPALDLIPHFLNKDLPVWLLHPAGEEQRTHAIKALLQEFTVETMEWNADLFALAPDLMIAVEVDEFAMDLPHDEHLLVIDIRNIPSFQQAHIEGSVHIPLPEFANLAQLASLPENANLYVLGESTEDALLAASLIKQQGLHNLRVVLGGFEAIKKEKKIPLRIEKPSKN